MFPSHSCLERLKGIAVICFFVIRLLCQKHLPCPQTIRQQINIILEYSRKKPCKSRSSCTSRSLMLSRKNMNKRQPLTPRKKLLDLVLGSKQLVTDSVKAALSGAWSAPVQYLDGSGNGYPMGLDMEKPLKMDLDKIQV